MKLIGHALHFLVGFSFAIFNMLMIRYVTYTFGISDFWPKRVNGPAKVSKENVTFGITISQ